MRDIRNNLSVNYDNFLQILDTSQIGVIVFKKDQAAPHYVNTTLATLLGYQVQELTQGTYQTIFPQNFFSAIADKLATQPQAKGYHADYLTLQSKEGISLTFSMSSDYVEVDGEPALICFFTLGEEKANSQIPAVRRERSLKDAQIVAKMGHWEWHITKDPYYSEELLNVYDFASGPEFTFEEFQRRLHPDDKERVAKVIYEALTHYTPYDIQYQYVLPSGQVKYLHSIAKVFADPAVNTQKMIGIVQDITQFVCTRQALERSEKVLKEAQRMARVGNWEWDILGDQRYYSDELLNIYQVPPDAGSSYQPFVDRYHPEDKDLAQQALREALQNHKPFDIQHRIVMPDGAIKYLHSTGEVTTTRDGKPARMMGIVQDITQERQAKQALEKSEKRLKRAQQIGKTGYWEWNIPADEVYWSDELYVLYELPKGEFKPSISAVIDMMLESEREQITQYIYGCLDQKLPHYQIEGHVVTGKGKPVYFLARAEIIYDESGNPIRMEGISQDITDLKKAEEELRFKEYLLQNVNDAIISTDMHMKITSWNKAAGQLYGYKAEEALGKTLHELLKFDFPPPESSYQQQFSHTGSYRGQLTMQQKEGTRVIVEAHTILLKDKKGNSIGRVSVDRDITHISQMQHKVYESQSMLQLVINTVPQAVFWKDLSHVYTGCNENFVHMFQLTGVEEILGKKDNQMYWADTHAKELQLQDEQILAGILPRLFYTKSFKTRNGSNIWLEVRLVPLYSQEGQIIGVLGTVEDITEEVDTEQALIQSKANMEAIIENTDDLIWAIDKDFKIIAMNSNLARFWSQFFDAPLQVGDSCYDMQPLWVQKRWVQIQKIVLSGQKKMLSRRFKLKDTFRWFDIACFPIIEANGQINGASYVARDVTERKTQEKLILKYLKQHSQLKLVQEKQKMMAVVKGQEEERRLISMELHDGVGQMLTALHFKMNKLTGKMLPVASADITIPLEEIVKLQKNIYQEVRRISENLMPQFLNDFPLEQALDQLTLQSFHNTGIEVEATYALHKRTFEKSIEIAIFRMAQEIFTNILKHSQATKVTVAMQLRKSAIFLLVKDNGVGFDMSVKTHKMGKGLNNISHRVSLLSGTFVVATHPGEGFQIQIKIPVSAYEKN